MIFGEQKKTDLVPITSTRISQCFPCLTNKISCLGLFSKLDTAHLQYDLSSTEKYQDCSNSQKGTYTPRPSHIDRHLRPFQAFEKVSNFV